MTHPHGLRLLAPPLRRGPGAVQLGVATEDSLVVEGLSDAQVRALEALDGLSPLPGALDTPHGRALVDALTRRGLLVEGPPAPGRPPVGVGSAAVVVVGRGPVPQSLAARLRRGGVGRVDQGAWSDALGTRPSLVVLVGAHAVDAGRAEPHRRAGTPVVPLVVHAREAVVGPVVLRTGPCLRCLDLARTDLDPAWPLLLGQLTGSGVGAGPAVHGPELLVDVAVSLATAVALATLTGDPGPTGRSLEVGLPWPTVRSRTWSAHPRCPCGRTRITPPPDATGPSSVRMAG